MWGLRFEQEHIYAILTAIWVSAACGQYVAYENWETMRGKDHVRAVIHDTLKNHRTCYQREAAFVLALDAAVTKKDEDAVWQSNIRSLIDEICERTEARHVHHFLPTMEELGRQASSKLHKTVLTLLNTIEEGGIAHIFL